MSDGINLGFLEYLGYLGEGDGIQRFVLGDGIPLGYRGYLGKGEGKYGLVLIDRIALGMLGYLGYPREGKG